METENKLFPNELLSTWFIQDRLKIIFKEVVLYNISFLALIYIFHAWNFEGGRSP